MNNDINFILFHKGSIPNFFSICIKQIEKTQTNYKIHILTDQQNINLPHKVININSNNAAAELQDLRYYVYDSNPLWRTSFERFFYIRDYIKRNELNNVIHFDNDVLLYENVYNALPLLQSNIKDIGLTPHKINELVCGFMYIKYSTSLDELCDKLLMYAKYGEARLQNILNSMPHEMRLLGEIKNTTDIITELPVSPIFPGNNLFEELQMVFDPSSYGQHIGGTHSANGADKGQVYLISKDRYIDHHIGNKDIEFIPYFDENKKRPFILYNKEKISIFNLHIHSKQLHLYT